jgi:hypothetical protein
MELLLNLCWLMLALPAYWLWRRSARSARKAGHFESRPCLLVLGCVLLLLFPVVSATDDLQAMRPEAEESSSTTRTLKDAAPGKSSSWLTRMSAPPAHAVAGIPFLLADSVRGLAFVESDGRVSSRPAAARSTRAPPFSLV